MASWRATASASPAASAAARPPDAVARDRGPYSPENEARAQERGACLAGVAATRAAALVFRFRAGAEGRIHLLKRDYGLAYRRDCGEAGFGRHIGRGILTHNLAQIASTQATRPCQATRRVV